MLNNRVTFASAIGLAVLALFMFNGAEAATLNNPVITPDDSRVDGAADMNFLIEFDDGHDGSTLNGLPVLLQLTI